MNAMVSIMAEQKQKGLTEQQRSDVDLLIHQGGHTLETAICEVIKPKVKVRAPNWDDLKRFDGAAK